MVDALRADGFLGRDDRLERHQGAARRLERDLLEGIGVLLVPRIDFQHDLVLGVGSVDGRRPSLPIAGGQRVFDLRRIQPQGGGLVPVDREVDPRALHLQIVRHILDFRNAFHGGAEAAGLSIEVVGVQALHGDVVRAAAYPRADLERGRQVDEDVVVREAQELTPKLL